MSKTKVQKVVFDAESYLYEQIVETLTRQILQGSLKPGDKVPSVRKLSAQLSVSVSSVVQAYMILESQGLVEARPQSGYYVSTHANTVLPEPEISSPISASVEVNIHTRVRDVLQTAMDPHIVQLGAALPCPSLIPVKTLQRLHNEVMKKHGVESLAYNFSPGSPEFRRQIAQRALSWGCRFSADDIILTNGAIEAVNLSLRAVASPGDVIAVESPMFFGLLETIESLGMHVLELPTHPRDGIDVEALEKAIQRHQIKACLFMPNFNNPMGSLMPLENKEKMVGLLAKHDIPLIENDVYGDLHFAAKRPLPAKAFDKKGLVLYCASFSKSLAPSLRVGWSVPGQFADQIRRLKYTSSVATPTLSQFVVSSFIHSGGYDKHLRTVQRAFSMQIFQMTRVCQTVFPEGTKLTRPQGGHLMWVEFPDMVDTLLLHQEAIKHRISISPGVLFSAHNKYHNCIRLNCGYPVTEDLRKSLKTLGELAQMQIDQRRKILT